MRIEITVDSQQFWQRLCQDIARSKDYAYFQMMTFEGDGAGIKLAEALHHSPAKDKRIIVDRYTRFMISDRFVYLPKNYYDSALHTEVQNTRQMMGELRKRKVRVKWVNPMGPLLFRFAARNHKKIIAIDDKISYLGGINFSDHNFLWHDMMLRIEDEKLTRFLKQDFLSTWQNRNLHGQYRFEDIDLYLFDGRNNEELFSAIFRLIENARERIYLISPYLTAPFFCPLAKARLKGVDVNIVAPGGNNRPLVTENLIWEARQLDLRLLFLQNRMSHLKAMLVDDDYLLVGSCNFDYISYTVQQELIAVVRNPHLISEFKRKVLEKDVMNSIEFNGQAQSCQRPQSSRNMTYLLRFAVALARLSHIINS